ncbi:alpha-2-macroglobulin [Inhella sp.]|uniref:alpha-2-macroglobulin family protein n=1 Tax=Inhella sp. TaxID=1921806 RepID=UPI0035AF0CC5
MGGGKQALAALGLVAGLVGAVVGLRFVEARGEARPTPALIQAQGSTDAPLDGPYRLMGCSATVVEQQVALRLSFSQPVDAGRGELDRLLRVVDLGDAAGRPGQEQGAQAAKPPPGAASAPLPSGKLVQGHWVLEDDARHVHFTNVQPQRRYRVELLEGLKSVDGEALPGSVPCELATNALPPAFFFASRGIVLPAGQNGGLPIVTVAVPEVDVQFLRVSPDKLPRFLERLAGGRSQSTEEDEEGEYYGDGWGTSRLQGRTDAWQLDRWKAYAEPVHLARYPTGAHDGQRKTSFLPVEQIRELQDSGAYIAVMSRPGRFAEGYEVAHFYVSDIGLQLQRQGSALSAFATSLKSGKALTGVRVELLDAHGRVRAAQESDGDGHARFAAVPKDAVLALARRGQEITPLRLREAGLDLSEFDIQGFPSRNVRLFAYAGRDLYRPGESFTVSVLLRDADGGLLQNQPIQATLKQPDGKTVTQETWLADPQSKVGAGYLQHLVALSADAATGTWTLELRHDPASKEPTTAWRFQVEEFLPERMKLQLTAPDTLGAGDAFEVTVQGDYLYGAPAAGNALIVQAASERQREALPRQWPGFYFGDVADDGKRSRAQVADTQLSDAGQARVTLPKPEQAASPMRVTGSFSLLESGGRPVVRSIERTLWPAAAMVGLRPLFDRDVAQEGGKAAFELIRVNARGEAQPLAGLKLRLLREDRQYHWRFDEHRGWQSGFVETEALQHEQTVNAAATRTALAFPVSWGRYLLEVRDPQTGLAARYRFYAGWGAQEAERIGNRPDRVKLAWVEGAPFKAGQTAKLRLEPPHDGEALVTVQSGAKLLWVQRLSVKAAGETLSIPVGEGADWARHDLYATVTAFRPGSQGDRVTPARAVGLLHLPLDRKERALRLNLQAPAKSEPEKRVAVKLKMEGAKAGDWVTLSAVDVGILNITRYASPDPLDFFFGKQRFGAEWLDMYGRLIEKMDGELARMRWGGDAAKRDTQSLPQKVKLVDLFSGPVAFNAQGEATVLLNLPDFNGQLRLMAVAGSGARYAKAEAEMTVAAPLVAELSTPRFIAPGDSAQVALDLTNLSGTAQSVTVSLNGEAPLRVGGKAQTAKLADQQRQILRWPLDTVGPYGLAKLTLSVQSSAGLKLKRESWLQVQPPYAAERDGRRMRVMPGESLKLEAAWAQRFHPASSQVSLVVSDAPPLNIKALVQGLLDYPYGCLEQTTSGAYPYLFVDEAAAQAWGLKPVSLAERQQRVSGALGRIAGMQLSNGGYTLWGNGTQYESYLAAYVLGFLQDAKAAGFAVPEALHQRSVQWMQGELAQAPNRFPTLPRSVNASGPTPNFEWRDYELMRDSHRRFAELAHIGYQLAREQKAPLSTLRYLHDSVRERARSPLPLVHLALALKLMGDERRAMEALNDAMQRPYGILPKERRGWWTGWWWDEWLGDYGSPVRDLAMSYALLHRHEVKHERREQLLMDAADRLGNRRWASTQERVALVQAARAAGGLKRDGPWSATLKVAELTQSLESRTSELRGFPASRLAQGVQLSNTGSQPLFVEVETSGFPTQAPAFRDEVIELQRDWLETDGSAYNGRALKVGEMLMVRLKARARTPIKDGLIVDAVPAGLEIENLNLSQGAADRMVAGGQQLQDAAMDPRVKHREFRDDRYVAAAELGPDWVSIYYLLRVVSPGRFTVPAPMAEDMYRPELRGVGRSGGVVEVAGSR